MWTEPLTDLIFLTGSVLTGVAFFKMCLEKNFCAGNEVLWKGEAQRARISQASNGRDMIKPGKAKSERADRVYDVEETRRRLLWMILLGLHHRFRHAFLGPLC
jgi:hypothetical protein